MFSKSFMSLFRFSGFTLTVLFLAATLSAGAQSQTAPAAIASFASGVNHTSSAGSIGTLGTIADVATDSFGDLLAVDAANGALYEFPVGGGDAVVLVTAGQLAPVLSDPFSIFTPGVAVDSANNLYIEEGTCVLAFPYDTTTRTWDALSNVNSSTNPAGLCGTSGAGWSTFYNFGSSTQPWGIAISTSSTTPSLLVGTSPVTTTAGGSIVSIPIISSAGSAPTGGTSATVVSSTLGAPISITQDPSANIYFVEYGKGALAGAYEVPAAQALPLASDSSATRIDPSLPQVTGVAADIHGDVYIGDNTEGVFEYPAGAQSSSSAFLISSVTAQGEVAFSGSTGLFVPTTQTQSNGNGDIAQVAFNAAQFGPIPVGATTPGTESVTISFNASTTPTSIEVLEAGKSTPDFTLNSAASNTCLSPGLQAPYGPGTTSGLSCPVSINFAPQSPGNVSATLVVLGAKNALLASIPLNGSGTGAAVQITPAAQSTIGGSLVTPSQMAVDANGNVYVADPGLKAVEMYPAAAGPGAAGTPVGTGLVAPTGVAVDGAGDVFIADSGNVYEVPESQTSAGTLNVKGQITLKTGLGSQVQLAADGVGDLYISDATNNAMYELENFSTGWNTSLPGVLAPLVVTLSNATVSTPSAIAVDPYNNVFVVDGSSVYEITPSGTQTAVLTGVGGIDGLAVDPSDSLYASIASGAIRFTDQNPAGQVAAFTDASNLMTPVAAGTVPAAVALDSLGDIYVADDSQHDVNFTSATASLQFAALSTLPSSEPLTATLLNYGNAALKVTGYTSVLNYLQPNNAAVDSALGVSNYQVADFTETDPTTGGCIGNSVAVNATCQATITFSPAPGDGGNLTEQVTIQGNQANAQAAIDASGTAPTLAAVTVSAPTSTTGTIENVPVNVTVTPTAAGSPTPSGTVTLTVQYGSNVPLTYPTLPTKYQLTVPLNSSGVATFNGAIAQAQLPPTITIYGLPIGNYTFTARYNGDTGYTYANSTNTAQVAVTTPVPTVTIEPAIPLCTSATDTNCATAVNTPPALPSQLEPYQLPCTSGPPTNCTNSFSWGQPASNPPGYLVVGGNCTACLGSWGSDGTVALWTYTYPLTVASASGDPMVGTAAYVGTGGPFDGLGSVNYLNTTTGQTQNGQSVCGPGDSASVIDVFEENGVDSAAFPPTCAPIVGLNVTTVPVFMAFYTFTPQYSGEYSDLSSEINPNYKSSTSAPVNIWGVAHPVVQISSSPAALIVAQGSSASATLTLSSVLGYGYIERYNSQNVGQNYAMPLALQCQGLPAYASCSFTYPAPNLLDQQSRGYAGGGGVNGFQLPNGSISTAPFYPFQGLLCQSSIPPESAWPAPGVVPGPVTAPQYCAIDIGPPLGSVTGHGGQPTSGMPCDIYHDGCVGPGTVIMTITTGVPLGTSASLKTYRGGIVFASLFGLGLLGLTFRRRVTRLRNLLMVVCALLWGGTLIGITACSTTTLGTPTATTGVTPVGTYWVTVTADQVGSLMTPPSKYNDETAILANGNGNQMSLPYTINVTITNPAK